MKKIVITQTRSTIKYPKRQEQTLQSLGLGRIGKKVEHTLTPSIEGMIQAVSHLVSVRPAGAKK